jgi:two-component system, OmpR family, phosphate regulon sensor histidine kinase PhoR
MQAQAERMSRLIEDLLSLSRIEMREHVPPTTSVDVNGVVQDALSALKQNADKNGITLRAQLPADPTLVIGDRDELAQVAQNLVQNAIKYGRRGGHVDVSVSRHDARVELAVTDDGIGIAPEHLPRVAERFYRVSAQDSKERGGTGLGLAIVKHIVNRHRGELQITSVLGEGSTFTAVMPAATSRT